MACVSVFGVVLMISTVYLPVHVVKYFLGQVLRFPSRAGRIALEVTRMSKIAGSEAAKALGALGAAKGGEARAKALSPEERSRIAREAVEKRWAKAGKLRPEAERVGLRAIEVGSFKDEFGIDVDCYVLNDAQKTAVISQRGMAQAIGFSKRGDRLAVFANSKTMDGYIGRDLREKLSSPLVFQRKYAAAENPVGDKSHGYDATILIDICQAILAASKDGKLAGPRYEKMIANAQVILGASAKSGIKGLVYALSGYNPTAQEVIDAFKAYVQEEAKKYEREFPNELYLQWHRLYKIPVPERGKPWQFRHLTVKHIYYPLAKSNGKLLTLLRALKAQDGSRQNKLFQFLNDIGARALRMQLGRVLEMGESSKNQDEYERKIAERFGGQQEIDFDGNPQV